MVAPVAILGLASLSMSGGMLAAALSTGQWLDAIISVTGLGITGLAALWWILYDRRNPLRASPPRPHRLRPESVLIAAGVYLLAASLIAMVIPASAAPTKGLPPAPEVPEATPGDQADSTAPAISAPVVFGDSAAKIIGVAACLSLIGRGFEGGLRRFFLGRRGAFTAVAAGLVLAVVALPICYSVLESTMWALQRALPDYSPDDHSTIRLLRDPANSPFAVFGLYFGAAVVAPLAEEVFFRGILQTVLVAALGSRWLAILITAAAFAALHPQLHTLPPLFVLGIILGFAYERTGGLVTPLLIHALFNGKTLLWNAVWPPV